MGWFSAPTKINPETVGNYMQNPASEWMREHAKNMIDMDSPLMQAMQQNLDAKANDTMWQSNIINRRNNAGSNQSGITDANANQNMMSIANSVAPQMRQMLQNNIQQSGALMGNVASHDAAKGDAMASAYGQNITNKNNYNSAMAGNVMQLAGGAMQLAMMCDKRMKENIKKVGKIKIANGKTVPLYNFNYKGRKNKKTNVMAQDVEKVLPEAVFTGKNGLKYVETKKLYGLT